MLIEFPDPDCADENGLLAAGGDLTIATLLTAYDSGIFPWYGEGQPILWWSPNSRMVLFPDEFYISKRLQRRLSQDKYQFSYNKSFHEVIVACASIPRAGQDGTWIFPEMIEAYMHLHEQGHAHSFEVWQDDNLIGGLYGVLHKQVFFAESMFSCQRDGSKMAMAQLVQMALEQHWKLIDCQFHTKHLASLGAREIPRYDFMHLLLTQ
ncbi:MAG: leucyl/phenylalanyl-tRNA--protein transferase [Mariprofundaceae bacterium]